LKEKFSAKIRKLYFTGQAQACLPQQQRKEEWGVMRGHGIMTPYAYSIRHALPILILLNDRGLIVKH